VHTRPPAAAGVFYSAERSCLAAEVDRLLVDALQASAAVTPSSARPPSVPKAVIAPHAGYAYSGPVAAAAFAPWRSLPCGCVKRVIVIGPAHFAPVRAVASTTAEAFSTPLGPVRVDEAALAELRRHRLVSDYDPAHAREHSLEVELPFLQRLFPEAAIVPLAVGDLPFEEVAAALDACWGGPETVIVVSSDLSHYLPYEAARRADGDTARRIAGLEAGAIDYENACGAVAVNALLYLGARRGLEVAVADLRNSRDTMGCGGEVVGYGAFHFRPSS
jgi:hypothetical protein